MSKRLKQQLVVKQKTQLKLKPRLIITGSTLAVAVLFGIGFFMYGNLGNNTESFAAKKKPKTVTATLSAPDGPSGITAVCSGSKIELTWTNNTVPGKEEQPDGILILKKSGVVTEDQTIRDLSIDSTGNVIMDISSLNGWQVVYNGNLITSFTDEKEVTGIFTYLVYEKNGGVKCTPAKKAGRIFILNGESLSAAITGKTDMDGLYLPASCTLTIDSKGSLNVRKDAVLTISGTVVLKGELENNASSWTFTEGSQFIYNCNGNRKNLIPAAEWQKGSVCIVNGMENKEPKGLNQSFADFVWNCKNQTADALIPDNFSVKGDMKILSTGKKIKSLAFSGNTYFSGNVFVDDLYAQIDVKKKNELVMSGSEPQTLSGKWNLETFTVNNPTAVTVAGEITVSKALNLTNGTIQLKQDEESNNLLRIGDEAVINRAKGTLSQPPVFFGSYSLVYSEPCTTGNELAERDNVLSNLTMNCEGEVVLNKDININSALHLINGRIVTGEHEVVMRDNSPKAIKEFSAASYVAGNLRRMVNGKSDYDFPVGTVTHPEFLTVNLNGTGGFSSLLAQFNPEKQDASSITAGTRLNGTLVSNFLNNGYWSLIPNKEMTSGSFNVTLCSKGQTNSAPSVGCYCVMTRNNKSSNWSFSGKHSMKTQYVNNGIVKAARSNVNSLGDFAIAYSSASIILSKTYLTVSLIKNQHVDIIWQTNAEMNLPSLVLQHSTDAVHFESIGEMKNGKEKDDMQQFSFRDAQPLSGVSYYRVKQTDMDGTVTYSDIRFIDNTMVQASSK